MEEESSHNEDEKQAALKSLLFCEGEECEVQHDDDDDSGIKLHENVASTDSTSDCAKAQDSSPRRSPDPNCAICLGTLENKSFTDSCFHTFCFTCLLEWSKVKAECPLCKQSFKSIVHNVRSIEDYDQYDVSSKSTHTSWRGSDGRSFRYRSTLTSERWTERHCYRTFGDSIEYRTHRMTYAPHSVPFPAVRNLVTEHPCTSSYRRYIYENGLWVKPLGDGNTQKYRITSPEFYRQNPACTDRLAPWLNRELSALLYDSESQITFVLELILALIMCYDIRSEEFYIHIEPYLQHRTSHFIHEFFNFASSLHDMHSYDGCAVYEKLESISENSAELLSPDIEMVAITSPSISFPMSPHMSAVQDLSSSGPSRKKSKKSSKRQPKLFLRRNQESNIWHSVLPASSHSLNSSSGNSSSDHAIASSFQEFLDLGVVSGPSTSGLQIAAAAAQSKNSPENVTSGFSSDSNDDDCVVVDIVKPRALRTPELINLASSSEDERTLDMSDIHNYCATRQENTPSEKRKELQHDEEAVGVRGSKKRLRLHRKGSTTICSSNTLKECSENLNNIAQSPVSPPPHDQGVPLSLPISLCKTYIENDETRNVTKPVTAQELFLYNHNLLMKDSPPQLFYDRHVSSSSSSVQCSQNITESGKTLGVSKTSPEVSISREDPPSSIYSSLTETNSKMDDPSSFSVICTKQGSDFALNHTWPSLTLSEEKEKSIEKWQHNNSSCGSSIEENAMFETGENKGKLRSVICRFPATDQHNSRSDSSHHSSGHSKKHKHKKKKKKKHGKHKHHKHSHSASD